MKNYLIIGGSSGIGKAIREKLSSAGNNVYATYFQNDTFASEKNYFPLDVRTEEPDLSFLPEVLDGFVYCPGAIDLKPFNRIKEASIIEDLNLQVMGVVRILQLILPKLKASGQGSVVLFSTVAVQTGFPFHAQVDGGIEGRCGWITDKFGVSWQVVPSILGSLMSDPVKAPKTMYAFMQMKKFDIETLISASNS